MQELYYLCVPKDGPSFGTLNLPNGKGVHFESVAFFAYLILRYYPQLKSVFPALRSELSAKGFPDQPTLIDLLFHAELDTAPAN